MKDFFSNINLPFIAAILLVSLGIYYFIFEQTKTDVWMMLLLGALLNLYLAIKQKERRKKK
ncbi:MAG: hypothetical protein ACPGJS_16680 [Flammeovirgaceae bacterium]